jgi:hypothetical protein
MVVFAASTLVLIEARCPRVGAHRLGGELMEGLAQEFGTSPSEVNPFRLATLLSDGRQPEKRQCFKRALKTLSIVAEGRQITALFSDSACLSAGESFDTF